MELFKKASIFVILTIITQVGGVLYLLSLFISKYLKSQLKYEKTIIFIALYATSTFLIIPLVAPLFGREKVAHTNRIKPANYMTVVLNRNYVRPELNSLLARAEESIKHSKVNIRYLDANFPFLNKFPLLPHLSHNDGKKIDLSLIYENQQRDISHKRKSISGYGYFEYPKENEFNQIEKCLKNGYFQYDYPKYLTFGSINPELVFSESGTKILITGLLENPNLGKLFIEPHLKQRLNLKSNTVRYHGCGAVRHDDHIHIQLK
ncbi:MAG: hypothetical protein KAH22_09090 [Thiotrichaceae bacterium]|nr:hypothetical protein [Thiotrichaceae bacterium]